MRKLLLAAVALAAMPAIAQLTPSEAAGRRIYQEGVSGSGHEISAQVGMGGATLPGTAVACGNCHGADGLGRAEAGVDPSVITWSQLTKSYGHVHANGRRHPAYDDASFARVVSAGMDPGGNRLEPAMPRYALHPDDLRDLLAYMKRLERDLDAGVSDRAITIGTLLPAAAPAVGEAMKKAMEAAFQDVNAAGGLYGRRIELVARSYAPDAALQAARDLVERDHVFALVSPFALGTEPALARFAEEGRIPVIGPFTIRGPASPPGRYTFYLFGGVPEQAEVLVSFGQRNAELSRQALAIVHPDDADSGTAAQAALARCHAKGCALAASITYHAGVLDAPRIAARCRDSGAAAVLFLGPAQDLERFAQAAADAQWFPALLSPGMLAARAIAHLPATFAERLYLSYPMSPPAADGANAFDRFAEKHHLSPSNALPAFSSYLAASLLVDGLRRTGRDVSRERLVQQLESTTDYRTPMAEPLRYGPQRRIGALGGHVVKPAAGTTSLRAASGWISLD
ncbi:MAG: ABC transporter substrate-binding protein [Betaproteobacteria bacterium]